MTLWLFLSFLFFQLSTYLHPQKIFCFLLATNNNTTIILSLKTIGTNNQMTTIPNEFADVLHQLLNTPRPKPGQEQPVKDLVIKLVDFCCNEERSLPSSATMMTLQMWKRLVLSLLYKRYHMLSPEAKKALSNDDCDESTNSTVAAGDGERLIFYTAVQSLFDQATTQTSVTASADEGFIMEPAGEMAASQEGI